MCTANGATSGIKGPIVALIKEKFSFFVNPRQYIAQQNNNIIYRKAAGIAKLHLTTSFPGYFCKKKNRPQYPFCFLLFNFLLFLLFFNNDQNKIHFLWKHIRTHMYTSFCNLLFFFYHIFAFRSEKRKGKNNKRFAVLRSEITK